MSIALVIMEQIMRWTAHVWITVIDLDSGVATPVVRSSGIVRSSLMKRPPAQKAASGAVWLTSSFTLAMLCGAYSKEAERMIDMLDTIYLRDRRGAVLGMFFTPPRRPWL